MESCTRPRCSIWSENLGKSGLVNGYLGGFFVPASPLGVCRRCPWGESPRTIIPSTRRPIPATAQPKLRVELHPTPMLNLVWKLRQIWPCGRLPGRLFCPSFASRRVSEMSLGREPQDNHSFHTETNTGDCVAKTEGRAASGPDSQFGLKFEANPAQELLFSDSSFDPPAPPRVLLTWPDERNNLWTESLLHGRWSQDDCSITEGKLRLIPRNSLMRK